MENTEFVCGRKMDGKMVIIQLAGGLGNQMFQYALYLQLKDLGREVKIDDVSGFAEDPQRIPALAPFGITYERPTKEELRKMLDSSMMPWHRVRRKLFGRHKKSYFEAGKLFIPEVLTWDDIYLEGYWQTEKYFKSVEKQVRAVYDTDRLAAYLREVGVPGCDGGENSGHAEKGNHDCGRISRGQKNVGQYLREIDNECSVSIHVRRGDYLVPDNQMLYGGICTDAYYIEGIRQMRERYPGCRFFLFTNDRAWAGLQFAKNGNRTEADGERDGSAKPPKDAKHIFSGGDVTWIDLPGAGDNDYAEFLLMSRCKHHILANSSFSWWASYLNKNPGKTVLAPPRWLNGVNDSDFYRADMRKVTLVKET